MLDLVRAILKREKVSWLDQFEGKNEGEINQMFTERRYREVDASD